MKKLLAICSAILIQGCASVSIPPREARAVINSNPPGATISSSGKSFGTAPVSLTWQTVPGASTTSEPITATWVSGATQSNTLNLVAGQSLNFVFTRPTNAPGLDSDVKWAMHMQRKSESTNSVDSDSFYELGKALGGALGGGSGSTQAPQSGLGNPLGGGSRGTQAPQLNCRSAKRGSVVYTDCN